MARLAVARRTAVPALRSLRAPLPGVDAPATRIGPPQVSAQPEANHGDGVNGAPTPSLRKRPGQYTPAFPLLSRAPSPVHGIPLRRLIPPASPGRQSGTHMGNHLGTGHPYLPQEARKAGDFSPAFPRSEGGSVFRSSSPPLDYPSNFPPGPEILTDGSILDRQ